MTAMRRMRGMKKRAVSKIKVEDNECFHNIGSAEVNYLETGQSQLMNEPMAKKYSDGWHCPQAS